MDNEEIWSEEFPWTPGWYWFYGILWYSPKFDDEQKDKYTPVEVIATGAMGEGRIYIAKGAFIYESDERKGLWAKAVMPIPPKGLQDHE